MMISDLKKITVAISKFQNWPKQQENLSGNILFIATTRVSYNGQQQRQQQQQEQEQHKQ